MVKELKAQLVIHYCNDFLLSAHPFSSLGVGSWVPLRIEAYNEASMHFWIFVLLTHRSFSFRKDEEAGKQSAQGKGNFQTWAVQASVWNRVGCGLRVWQRQQLKKSKSTSPSVRSVPAGVTHRPFHHCLVNPELTLHLVNLCFFCIFRLWEMTLWFTETFVLTLYPPAPQASDFSKCWEGKVSQLVRTLSLLS